MLKPIVFLLSRLIPGNDAYPLFSEYGYHLLKKHYYIPIPDESDLSFQIKSELKGVKINEMVCFDLIKNVLNKYKTEWNTFPIDKTENSGDYYLLNGNFMAIDGNLYYSFIRHLKPEKILKRDRKLKQ